MWKEGYWYVIELKTLYVLFPISHIFFCFILNILFFEDNIVSNNIIYLFIYLFVYILTDLPDEEWTELEKTFTESTR